MSPIDLYAVRLVLVDDCSMFSLSQSFEKDLSVQSKDTGWQFLMFRGFPFLGRTDVGNCW